MKAPERDNEHHHDRLAELVWHLTECEPSQALAAVDRPQAGSLDHDTALALVARGICRVKRLDLTDAVDLRDPAKGPRATAPQ
jgi:hypothetical protein